MPAKIDDELDLHGHTAASARNEMEGLWSRRAWQGMRRVRIIHGTGEVLYRVVRQWADDKAIPWTLEEYNPGVTILQPALRREGVSPVANKPFERYGERLRAIKSRAAEKAKEEPIVNERTRAEQADLFEQELARLESQEPRSLHRRKQGL